MKKEKPMGLLLNGSVRSAGVTFYLKQGQMIVRSSKTVKGTLILVSLPYMSVTLTGTENEPSAVKVGALS